MNAILTSKSWFQALTVAAVVLAQQVVASLLGAPDTGFDLAAGSGLGLLAAWGIGHCDGLDGPVIRLAVRALDTGNVNHVLPWVTEHDEPEIRSAFDHAMAVRQLGPDAKALADRHFFETLVRVHRAGEGAPFTGLAPGGRDLGPAVPAADQALEDGSIERVIGLLTDAVGKGVRQRFHEAFARRNFSPDEVTAGREFVAAYVPYVHYVERLWQDAAGAAQHHHSAAEEGAGHAH